MDELDDPASEEEDELEETAVKDELELEIQTDAVEVFRDTVQS